MIPTVEDILSDLSAGKISLEQARKWIDQHLDLAQQFYREELIALADAIDIDCLVNPEECDLLSKNYPTLYSAMLKLQDMTWGEE